MTNIGYGRVSTKDQDHTAQHRRLKEAGCEEVYVEKITGRLGSRPELDKALAYLREGDTFTVTKLDRLGRSVKNLAELGELFRVKGVNFVVLDQGIDTSSAAGRFFFNMLASVAEFEADLNHERTLDGLATARARGRKGGRPTSATDDKVKLAQEMYDAGRIVEDIAKTFNVSRPTIYRWLEKAQAS